LPRSHLCLIRQPVSLLTKTSHDLKAKQRKATEVASILNNNFQRLVSVWNSNEDDDDN